MTSASKDLVHAKSQEIVGEIAKNTGVSHADVAKVLDHLGFSAALTNRLNVTSDNIRIAAGQLMQ
ncbi:hypothetical protein MOV61_06625 [Neorhizobium sp. BETTINA12A]|uniref:hypothetical protein n=1 Tax=Neorhizobium sp. BETTINA12A TaxID=2908924 RepID=UPI001FF3B52C|nr:hypothetical protein [Neorhizobium sp. BETTINA12A]MCJ9750393.1 hypothetical protein [Neorhizobium sp. BETTINA12A]